MKRLKSKWWVIVLVILVALIGWRYWVGKQQAKAEIKFATVVRKDVVNTVTASGEIGTEKKAVLNFPSTGKLGYIGVKEGDMVGRGKTLAGMDVADLDATVTKAWYSYSAADAAAKKAEDEVKGHDKDETYTQKNTRVAAQTFRDSAYETWIAATRAKSNSYLVAPFAGVVTEVTANVVGDTIGMTDGVTVVDPASLNFEAEVDETNISKIYVGQEVKLELDAFPNEGFRGTVDKIGFAAQVSSSGSTVYVVGVAPQSDVLPRLRLGMNGDVTFELERATGVLVLPMEAVSDGQVTLKNGQTVKIETGLESEQDVEIKSGLKEGDRVIVR